MRRFAKKPKNLQKKAEIFEKILSQKSRFAVEILNRSPLGHYTRMAFRIEGIRYEGMRQYYVRRSGIDEIKFQQCEEKEGGKILTPKDLTALLEKIV